MEILIAIECKNFKKPIPVEKIEAFHSKCLRIKGISKKVFVSSNGYQADAFGAAKDFEIDLYHLNEISQNAIVEWLPQIKQLNANIKIKLPYKISIDKDEAEFVPNATEDHVKVFLPEKEIPISIPMLLWNHFVVTKQIQIKNYMLLDFMRRKEKDYSIVKTEIPFRYRHKGLYTIGADNKKIPILEITASLVCWYEETDVNAIEAKTYGKDNAFAEANLLSLDIGSQEKIDIIFSGKKDMTVFQTTNDGNVNKLQTLVSYDPKEDKFEFYDYNESDED